MGATRDAFVDVWPSPNVQRFILFSYDVNDYVEVAASEGRTVKLPEGITSYWHPWECRFGSSRRAVAAANPLELYENNEILLYEVD